MTQWDPSALARDSRGCDPPVGVTGMGTVAPTRGEPSRAAGDGPSGRAVIAYVDEAGGEAARIAALLAHALGCGLLLAAVPQLPPHTPPGGDITSGLERRARERLATIAAGTDPSTGIRIAFGDPAHALSELARREAAAFIVVAAEPACSPTPQRSPLLAVAARAPCPVVVVGRDDEVTPP